ncbi:MAG: RtcB family protein [Anaerovoracaceae bacterium]
MELITKYGIVKIFAKTIEDMALAQIEEFSNSTLGENANIRIMPDCHAGKGCVIGTTMKITDKICPNLTGVDISCGVNLVKTDINFEDRLEELDTIINKYVPSGMTCHQNKVNVEYLENMKCWDKLDDRAKDLASKSVGTLGGGNHFLEGYKNGYLSVHSGSRNIGLKVADYYQTLAVKRKIETVARARKEILDNIEPQNREQKFREMRNNDIFNKDLTYLIGQDMEDYLLDISIIQQYAETNRETMLKTIVEKMNGNILSQIATTHNYIDTKNMILRKGAVSAQEDELLVIPMNMRDGMLICKGKGNADWNYSAPHGAGRLYSRTQAKKTFGIEEFQKSMDGIYSTCINDNTIDEAPFVYKNYQEIMECIEPTVEVLERILPIYNFKASEKN